MASSKEIRSYVTGWIRYFLYYSKEKVGVDLSFIIRKHIREQIYCRIESMDRKCFNDGSCKMCGCKTTALQMANKACDKPCYPIMLNKKQWDRFKKRGVMYYDPIHWELSNARFYNITQPESKIPPGIYKTSFPKGKMKKRMKELKNNKKWESTVVDIGEIGTNVETTVYFNSTTPLEIESIEPSCGCTSATYDGKDLKAVFNTGDIPVHLKQQGYYKTSKDIKVTYKGGDVDTLTFKVKIVNDGE